MEEEYLIPSTETTKKIDSSTEAVDVSPVDSVEIEIGLEGVKKSIEEEGVKKETNDLLEHIKEDQLKDTPGRKEAMESGNPAEMIKAFLMILSTLMKSHLGKLSDTTGYQKIKKLLGDQIEETIKGLADATPEQIDTEIQKYQKEKTGKSINKQIAYTYFISALQEYKLSKMPDAPKESKERIMHHLKNTVQTGDLLVLNKHTTSKKAEFGSAMLRINDGSTAVDYTHVVMVTSTDPLMFSHSTISKENSKGSGAEGNVSLEKYASNFKNLDIMHLKTSDTIKEQLQKNVADDVKRGAAYDSGAPTAQFLGDYASTAQERAKPDTNGNQGFIQKKVAGLKDNPDSFNCVEIITDNLPDNTKTTVKNASHPNDLLKMNNLFSMEYMTTYPGGIQLKTEKEDM